MIASCIEGRIRFRHPALNDPELLKTVTDQLARMPGITGLTANPRTGSLLVTHDAGIATADLLAMAKALAESQAERFQPQTAPRPARRRLGQKQLVRRTQKIGLATAMAATVATGLTDLKAAHLTVGFALAGLTAWHLFMYRRRFLA